MNGKYTSPIRFRLVQARRAALRAAIRRLAHWSPLDEPQPGYSVIIGCNSALARMLGCNLRMLAKQDRAHLREVIVVLDRPRALLPHDVEPEMRRRHPELPLRFLYYPARVARVCGLLGWAWIYAWLSWSIGIGACRTRHALLHDFDAMLLRENILRERYEAIAGGGAEYVGTRYYDGNGVTPDDELVTTFEMMFDAAFVRSNFRPIDLFNHVRMHNGRSVDFDTFLDAQARRGRRAIVSISEEDMVHPSQMICQFTELMNGRHLNRQRNSLLLIPYFLFLADGDPALMEAITRRLEDGSVIPFFGRELNAAQLMPMHADWLMKQAMRLEHALEADPSNAREVVRRYFERIQQTAQAADLAAPGRTAAQPASA